MAKDSPPIQITDPEVYILESLTLDDERYKRFEGKVLSSVLSLCGKPPIYRYFRTRSELVHFADEFRKSGYRYLHVSCHANGTAIATTLEQISYSDFAAIFQGVLRNRRLFMSACDTGNRHFANAIAKTNKGMYSIVAPQGSVKINVATAAWAALYVKLHTIDEDRMVARDIKKTLKALSSLLGIGFFVSVYNANKNKWSHTCTTDRERADRTGQ